MITTPIEMNAMNVISKKLKAFGDLNPDDSVLQTRVSECDAAMNSNDPIGYLAGIGKDLQYYVDTVGTEIKRKKEKKDKQLKQGSK